MTIKVSARMAHWGIRLACLGFALGFVGPAQPAVQACDIYCVDGGGGCENNEHYAYHTWMGTRSGSEHDCSLGNCDGSHPQCAPLPEEELEVLKYAVIAADRAKVQSILDEHPSLTVNIERSALQQLDCGGNVVVHIPVPSTLIVD
jgi:hypothetical protein